MFFDKICEICGCKIMGDFVKYDNFVLILRVLVGFPS